MEKREKNVICVFGRKHDFIFLTENHEIVFLTEKRGKKIQIYCFWRENMVLRFCRETNFRFWRKKNTFLEGKRGLGKILNYLKLGSMLVDKPI